MILINVCMLERLCKHIPLFMKKHATLTKKLYKIVEKEIDGIQLLNCETE